MQHCMLDLETFGTSPDSIIISLAAVQFDPLTGWTGAEFKQSITLGDQIKLGRKISGSTIQFWMEQKAAVLKQNLAGANPLVGVLADFYNWFTENDLLIIWGNSVSFDCGLLGHAYDQINLDRPWGFRNERCYRTMISFLDQKPEKDEGLVHDPLYDCKYQIKALALLYAKLKLR